MAGMISVLIVAAVRELLCSASTQSHCLPCYLEEEERAIVKITVYTVQQGADARCVILSQKRFGRELEIV